MQVPEQAAPRARSVVFDPTGSIARVPVEIPGTGVSAELVIRRVDGKTKTRWGVEQRRLEQQERARLAELRKGHSREDWPELYERELTDAAGNVVFEESEELFDKDNTKAKVPVKLKPLETPEHIEAAYALQRRCVADALVKVDGPVLVGEAKLSELAGEELLDAVEACGLFNAATAHCIDLQRPRPRQLF